MIARTNEIRKNAGLVVAGMDASIYRPRTRFARSPGFLANDLLISDPMTQLFPRFIRAIGEIGSRDGDEPSTVDRQDTGNRTSASRARSECVERETRIAPGRRERQERPRKKRQRRPVQEEMDEERAPRTLEASTGMGADEIPSMDMRLGPQRPDAFQPGQEVTCDYVHDEDLPGTSRKFNCAITKDDVVKVRYGAENGKVEGEVLATRLLWALGFGADAVYPVRVRCRGCSADPWVNRDPEAGERVFEPAAIERKFPGEEIKADKDGGWSWKELRHVDERLGGASLAEIDAMRLLAVFIQHTDNKIINERFVCLPGGLSRAGVCDRPFLYMHDVGLTFGHANLFDDNKEGSVSFEDWVATPMWRADPKMCVGHMRQSATGMLGDPQISEAGRQFLAGLLVQLTDKQLHDLFEVARVDHRSRKPGTEIRQPALTSGSCLQGEAGRNRE